MQEIQGAREEEEEEEEEGDEKARRLDNGENSHPCSVLVSSASICETNTKLSARLLNREESRSELVPVRWGTSGAAAERSGKTASFLGVGNESIQCTLWPHFVSATSAVTTTKKAPLAGWGVPACGPV